MPLYSSCCHVYQLSCLPTVITNDTIDFSIFRAGDKKGPQLSINVIYVTESLKKELTVIDTCSSMTSKICPMYSRLFALVFIYKIQQSMFTLRYMILQYSNNLFSYRFLYMVLYLYCILFKTDSIICISLARLHSIMHGDFRIHHKSQFKQQS